MILQDITSITKTEVSVIDHQFYQDSSSDPGPF